MVSASTESYPTVDVCLLQHTLLNQDAVITLLTVASEAYMRLCVVVYKVSQKVLASSMPELCAV